MVCGWSDLSDMAPQSGVADASMVPPLSLVPERFEGQTPRRPLRARVSLFPLRWPARSRLSPELCFLLAVRGPESFRGGCSFGGPGLGATATLPLHRLAVSPRPTLSTFSGPFKRPRPFSPWAEPDEVDVLKFGDPTRPLVAPRVSHCDLRGEWSAVVGPAEGFGFAVVGLDELDDPVSEFLDGVELAVADEATLQDGKEQLDLVQP